MSGDEQFATELLVTMARVSRRVRAGAPAALPPLQWSVLTRLDSEPGPRRTGELAAAEAVTAATMSRVLSALVEDGLAVRVPDPGDGRAFGVLVTAEGRARLARDHEQRSAMVAARIAELDPADRQALTAGLPALAALDARLAAPDQGQSS